MLLLIYIFTEVSNDRFAFTTFTFLINVVKCKNLVAFICFLEICNGSCNDTCTFDGRKYSEVAGLTNSISLSNMESILCLPFDIYQGAENILTHEFAHLVHKSLSESWKSKVGKLLSRILRWSIFPSYYCYCILSQHTGSINTSLSLYLYY